MAKRSKKAAPRAATRKRAGVVKRASAKAPSAVAHEATPRVHEVSGALQSAERQGVQALRLNFESGHVRLVPSGNRVANRDAVVRAINAVLGK